MSAKAGSLCKDGMVLSGDDLVRYSKRKGLCPSCARFQTHRRVGKLVKRNQWEPLTTRNEYTGEYQVYKGYCIQPTCYTLDQAKELLGEKSVRSPFLGDGSASSRHSSLNKPPTAQPPSRKTLPPSAAPPSTSNGRPSLSVTWERQQSQMSRLTTSSSVVSATGADSSLRSYVEHSSGKSWKKQHSHGNISPTGSKMGGTVASTRSSRSKNSHQWSRSFPEIEVPFAGPYQTPEFLEVGVRVDTEPSKEARPTQKEQSTKKGTWKKFLTGRQLQPSDNSIGCSVDASCSSASDSSLDETINDDNSSDPRHNITKESEAKQSSIEDIQAVYLQSRSLGYRDDVEMVAVHSDDKQQQWLRQEFLLDDSDQSNSNGVQIIFDFAETPLIRLFQNFSNDMEELELEANLSQYENSSGASLDSETDESPVFQTRAELEAEITACEAAIKMAETSDDPDDIETGIKSRECLPKLISLRTKYLSKQELEKKIKRLSKSMEKVKTKDLNKRLAIAKEKALFVDQLKAEIAEEDEHRRFETSNNINDDVAHSIPIGCSINISNQLANGSRSDISELDASFQSNSLISTRANIEGQITVFQSAPLAYVDPKTSIHHICPLLDFEYEARALRDSVKEAEAIGANIDIQFDIATIDRLSAFLTKGNSRVMHLSCHGHPNWLAIEDGLGSMQVFPNADLKRFIASSAALLELVFISSCHPRAAGNAFLEAGIRHVICCRQDDKFRDDEVIDFTRNFYRSLALNNNLKQAFNMAREAMRVSNTANLSKEETDKYMLLPEKPDEDPYHEVYVFSKATNGLVSLMSPVKEGSVANEKFQRLFPRIPPFFVGREIDMYNILESLRSNDVVCIRGQPKVGKTSLVSTTIRYIERRQKEFQFDDIMWLPAQENTVSKDDTLYFSLARMISLMTEATESPFHLGGAYTVCWARIAQHLKPAKQMLLAIHGKNFISEASLLSLDYFLHEILQVTNVKVILIGFRATDDGSNLAGGQCIDVAPLEFEPTVQLFARLFQSASYPSQSIVTAIRPLLDDSDSWRRTNVYNRLGYGIPSKIRRAAQEMTDKELSGLLEFAKRPKLTIHCRAQLEEEIEIKAKEEARELEKKNFKLAQGIRDTIDELESLRLRFPSLLDLCEEEKSVKLELDDAVACKNYDGASKIQDRLTDLQTKISKEHQWLEEAKLRRLPSF